MGELAMPGYKKILKRDTKFATFNVILLWILWYVSVFYMLVIMLNFLIAEITTSYQHVIDQKEPITYMQKASLNLEF